MPPRCDGMVFLLIRVGRSVYFRYRGPGCPRPKNDDFRYQTRRFDGFLIRPASGELHWKWAQCTRPADVAGHEGPLIREARGS